MRQSVRIRETFEDRILLALKWKKRLQIKECKRPLECGKGKETFSPGTSR